MKRYRRWFFTGLVVLAVELGCVALFNYIVDPNGVFRYGTWRHDTSHQFALANKNFVKTRYIAQHPEKFDCLVFGSSRVNGIDVRDVKTRKCYNMNYPGGLPRNHLDNLRYLLSKGAKLEIVLIGLDEFSYKLDPAEHFTDYVRHPYPPAVHQSTALFYLKYLVRYSSRRMKEPLEGFEGKKRPIPYDHYGTGLELAPREQEEGIEKDPVTYASAERFKEPLIMHGDRMNATLDEIKQIVDLLKAHRVKLVLFISPIHRTTYLATGLEMFLRFEKELSAISNFWDFSGLNSITTNNYYYYETSHYRPLVGRMLLARMLGDPNVTVPPDFGVLVTKENVDAHIAALRAQVAGLGPAVKW